MIGVILINVECKSQFGRSLARIPLPDITNIAFGQLYRFTFRDNVFREEAINMK